jgi:hypothetical protein
MASEYNDVMSTIGSTVQEDAESNTMAGWIDKSLLKGVQDELKSTYDLSLEFTEILDMMEEHGIDFGRNDVDYSVADLIWESMED